MYMEKIAEYNRSILQKFMDDNGLKMAPWSKVAGVSEGALRNFLSGRSQTMTVATLSKLARAANAAFQLHDGKIEISDSHPTTDTGERENLQWILSAVTEDLPAAPIEQKARMIKRFYNHLYPDHPISYDYALGRIDDIDM